MAQRSGRWRFRRVNSFRATNAIIQLIRCSSAECVGWVGRSLSSGNPEDVNFFLMQSPSKARTEFILHANPPFAVICLTLAPCFFSAAVYATLGMVRGRCPLSFAHADPLAQLIRHLGAQYSRLPPHLYLWIFCLADLVAIVIQAVGGGMAAIALLKKKGSVSGTNTMVRFSSSHSTLPC